jgi:D-glycero-D-manno-heptose 1,7-bisphosphate phosphatase
MTALRPAVFLDRDGTLVREVDYLRDPDDLELLPGAARASRLLAEHGFALVVLTNQSGIARGLLDEAILARVHARLREMLAAEGVSLARIDSCPHHPTEGEPPWRTDCDCRKPRPGMFLRAIAALGIDPGASWSVGDGARDLEAGARAGSRGILVATGKGEAEHARLLREGRAPARYVPDLLHAAELILSSDRR